MKKSDEGRDSLDKETGEGNSSVCAGQKKKENFKVRKKKSRRE